MSSELYRQVPIYSAERLMDLDLDSLRGRASSHSFILGMEFFSVRIAFMTFVERRLERPIHLENKIRLARVADRYGWRVEFAEGGSGWCVLVAHRLSSSSRHESVELDSDSGDDEDTRGPEIDHEDETTG